MVTKPNQVLIQVFYSGINDKDIDYVYNRSRINPKFSKHECLIGQEFSGLRTDNVSRVMGIRFSGSIATDVVTDSDLVYDIPDNWSLEEAATVPLSYFTCYYSLIIRCDLQEYESVLIISADSCLGQAAIAICLDKKCQVFASVDNQIQKQLLLKKFGNKLKNDFVFISDKITLREKILAKTNARKVDIVVNTKENALFESSLHCLKNCGKYIDLYNQHILDNKYLPLFALSKNISYNAIDIDYILRYLAFGIKPNPLWIIEVKRVHQLMSSGLRNGVIIPFSGIVYEREHIEKAFRSQISTDNCLSKKVIRIRNHCVNHENELTTLASPRNWFNPKKVYIITGGLGGFGFQLAEWMIERGAKQLVLTSRTGPKNKMQELFLKRFRNVGASVQISNRDLKTRESAQLLIEESESMARIGGIFHLAVVLNDNLFENQSPMSFSNVFEAKFQSLLFLDEITRHSHKDLEYFVAFSSISCGRGNQGQSNYGFANSSVERLCEDRRKHGLHALAIQWGPIDDVGLLADKSREIEIFKYSGLLAQRMPTCFAVLDMFLRLPYPIVSTLTTGQVMSRTANTKDSLLQQLAGYFGADSKQFADSATLGDIGIDSLISVEVQKRLEREFERSIPLTLIKNITVGQLRKAENIGRDAFTKIFVTNK
jgi:fatty acid synthase